MAGGIGRPRGLEGQSFSNQFRLRSFPSLHVCLEMYRDLLRAQKDFLGCLTKLAGKVLVCHCAPEMACHADVLRAEFCAARRPVSGIIITNGMHWSLRAVSAPVRQIQKVGFRGSHKPCQPDATSTLTDDRGAQGCSRRMHKLHMPPWTRKYRPFQGSGFFSCRRCLVTLISQSLRS